MSNLVRTMLVADNGNSVPAMIDDETTVVVVIECGRMRAFNYLPGQRFSNGEPIFMEGQAFIVKNAEVLKALKAQ